VRAVVQTPAGLQLAAQAHLSLRTDRAVDAIITDVIALLDERL